MAHLAALSEWSKENCSPRGSRSRSWVSKLRISWGDGHLMNSLVFTCCPYASWVRIPHAVFVLLSRTLNNGLNRSCSSVGRARGSETPCGVVDEKCCVCAGSSPVRNRPWSRTLNNGIQVGRPDTILQLTTGLALGCWSEIRMTFN